MKQHFCNPCIYTHKYRCIHLLHSVSTSLSKHFSQFSLPHCICQTVVNFISELQEQMCRFQKEINSKIQEKKALEIPADSSCLVACSTEPTKGRGSHHGPSCDTTSEAMHELEDVPDVSDGNTASLDECGADAEQDCHYAGESVGKHGAVLHCCVCNPLAQRIHSTSSALFCVPASVCFYNTVGSIVQTY